MNGIKKTLQEERVSADVVSKTLDRVVLLQENILAGTAHALNNALTPLMGNIEFLKSVVPSTPETEEYFSEIATHITRIRQYAEDSLLSIGTFPITPATPDLRDVVDGYFDSLQFEHDLHGYKGNIERHQHEYPVVVLGDPASFDRVLRNMVVIASKVSPEVNLVDVRTSVHDKYGVLDVQARPVELNEEQLSSFFDPYMLRSTTNKSLVGLEPTIVRGVARSSKGKIDVFQHEGVLTIRSEYPLADATITKTNPISTSGRTLLVIDDELGILKVAKKVLTSEGYNVHEAHSGEDALVAIQDGLRPNLVLSDYTMPGKNGLETHLEILRLFPDVKTVLMSGYIPESINLNEHKGIVGFLPKPYTLGQLVSAVNGVIKNPES